MSSYVSRYGPYLLATLRAVRYWRSIRGTSVPVLGCCMRCAVCGLSEEWRGRPGLRFLVLDSALQYAPESLDSDARTTSCVSAYHDRRASPNMAVGRYLCHA
eukprot:1065901-Rhodomonas_salina.1